MFKLPSEIQKFISTYNVLGIFPLDKILHFTFGLVITVILRWFRVKIRWIFLVIFILAALKEYNDYYVLNSHWKEQALDFLVTFIYPVIILFVIQFKKKLTEKKS